MFYLSFKTMLGIKLFYNIKDYMIKRYKRKITMATDEIKKLEGEEELLSLVKIDDETLSWEEVDKEFAENVGAAIDLQKDLVRVFTINEKVINENKELYDIASGILKSISDVVNEYKETRDLYINDIGNEIDKDNDDDVVKYLTIQRDFVETSEKFANLALIAVTDVMIRLNTETDIDLEEGIEELKKLKGEKDDN